jgi:hypothetical protein
MSGQWNGPETDPLVSGAIATHNADEAAHPDKATGDELAAEAAARIAADEDEATARAAANTALDGRVDTLEAAPAGGVQSVNGETGAVSLSAADVGASPTGHGHVIGDTTGLQAALDGKADDADVTTEASTRASADTALDTRVDVLEAAIEGNPWAPLAFTAFSWTALTTYALYIAHIDSLLSPTTVTSDTDARTTADAGGVAKRDRGACSDGSTKVYSYLAGQGKARTVIVTGQHAHERIGMASTIRFFQWFATSQDALARYLRTRLQIEAIFCANPAGYLASRTCPADGGTDPNRNYGHWWTRAATGSASYPNTSSITGVYKGTAAFSTPEATIVKAVVDAGRTGCVIDCHDLGGPDTGGAGGTSDELIYAAPSAFHLGHRRIVTAAAEQWHQVYNQDGSLSSRELNTTDTGLPQLCNWASWYLQHSKGRPNGAAVMVEAPGDAAGSTSSTTTATAIQRYASYMAIYLTRWLTEGQQSPPAYPIRATARRDADSATLTSTNAAIIWNAGVVPNYGDTTAQDTIYFLPPAPGHVRVLVTGYAFSTVASDLIEVRIEVDGTLWDAQSLGIAQVPGASTRSSFATEFAFSVLTRDASTVHTVRVLAKLASGSGSAVVRRARIAVEYTPHTIQQPVPIVNPVP